METKPQKITEYLVALPRTLKPEEYFSGIRLTQSDRKYTFLLIQSCRSRVQLEAARFAACCHAPAGILAAPRRFERAAHMALQACRTAAKFKGGRALFFDSIAHDTEYQSKYF